MVVKDRLGLGLEAYHIKSQFVGRIKGVEDGVIVVSISERFPYQKWPLALVRPYDEEEVKRLMKIDSVG